MTRKQIGEAIRKFDSEVTKRSDEYLAYQILFAAAAVGPHQNLILKLIQTNRWKQAILMIHRARRNNIFIGDKLSAEIYADEVGFAMGACCLTGMIKRVKAEPEQSEA